MTLNDYAKDHGKTSEDVAAAAELIGGFHSVHPNSKLSEDEVTKLNDFFSTSPAAAAAPASEMKTEVVAKEGNVYGKPGEGQKLWNVAINSSATEIKSCQAYGEDESEAIRVTCLGVGVKPETTRCTVKLADGVKPVDVPVV